MFHNPLHTSISCMLAWKLRFALSAERDKYVKHHRTFGGTGYVWLRSPEDAETATKILRGLDRGRGCSLPELRPRNAFI